MSIDDRELFAMMMEDQKEQDALYRPGPYWQGYQKRVANTLARRGMAEFRNTPAIAKGYADSLTVDPLSLMHDPDSRKVRMLRFLCGLPGIKRVFRGYDELVRMYVDHYLWYKERFYASDYGPWLDDVLTRFEMPETTRFGTRDVMQYKDRSYSFLYIRKAFHLDRLLDHVDFTTVRTLFEIGGGFGVNVHLQLTWFPNVRKVYYLDIPPMIYVGTQYLKNFYGDAVVDYRQCRDLESIRFKDDDSLEIICVCPWQVERLDSNIDLFWNTASFGEMPKAIVANYARHIKRLSRPGTRCALSINKLYQEGRTSGPEEVLATFRPEFTFQEVDMGQQEMKPDFWLGTHGHGG